MELVHARVRLALHALREGAGRPLLLLHGLGEQGRTAPFPGVACWPGPVHALDFTGHGASTVPAGGGYFAEVLMADADAALAHLGHATVLGRGLGAYVGLLLAGARPEAVRGVVLCDGPGLSGGGARPAGPLLVHPDPGALAPPDPFALAELARDVRPPDYAVGFVRMAAELSGLEHPVSVAARARPDWLRAVLDEPSVARLEPEDALASYARDA